MYKNALAMVSMIVLLFAVSCGGGGVATPDPGNNGGNGGDGAVVADTEAPEIVISGIDEGESYGLEEAGANLLNLKGVAADPSGVVNMAIRINDTLVASSNDSEVGFNWDVTGFDDGTYQVVVAASDGEGNIGSAGMTVYVNNEAFILPDLDLLPEIPDTVFDPDLVNPFPDPIPDPFPLPDFPIFPGV